MAFLPDLLAAEAAPGEALWIVSWGFNVPRQLRQLRGRPVAYHAHSSGYGFALPPGVPVLAVSRNTLGYWGDAAPRNPLFLVPNALGGEWIERGMRPGGPAAARQGGARGRRPVDVLVQQRKNSAYVLGSSCPPCASGACGWRCRAAGSTTWWRCSTAPRWCSTTRPTTGGGGG